MPNTRSTSTMTALRIHEWGALPQPDVVPRPTPAAGETLVRIEAAAATHLDLTVASGTFAIRPALPYIGGVEGAGMVVESAVFDPGSRVAVRGGDLGMGRSGTWAEYAAVPDRFVQPVPNGLAAELAATAFDPLTTAYVALHEIARLGDWPMRTLTSPQDEVVIVAGAAGAVGAAAAQLARRAGARVLGLVSRRERIADLPSGIEPIALDDRSALADLDRQRVGTVLIDTWGGPDLAARGHWVRPGGRLAVVGYVRGTSVTLDLPNWMFDDVAVLPVNMIEREDSALRSYPQLEELLVGDELHIAVERFPVESAATAFERLRAGQVNGRAAIMFG